ncbi:MAG: autotransporter-associated beta strand repeat-containing protein, partial [Thermoguttaceae bacterium]|nr:autotransporter-associated beta strand repeat-containing protein [Thermoguttaceae bacterium]
YKLHKSNAGTWEIAGTVKCGYFDVGGGTVKVVKGGVVTGTQLVLRDQDESEHTYTFTVDGGTATFTGDDHRLGHWGRHTGVVNINSGSFSAANTLTVGWDGTGKLYQTGGTASFGTLDIARTGSIIEFSGGTTTIDTLKIGVRGGNSYVEGGKVTFKGDSDVSLTNLYAYHGGTLNIEGNANVTVSNQAYFIQAKNSCTFTANQSGGTFTVNGAMALGHYRNAKVTYNMSGGTLNVPNYDSSQGQSGLWLAVDGSATLNQSGGIINTGRMNLNARDNEQTGTYVMTGGTLNVGTGGIMATQSGTGRYVIKLEKGTITAGASTLTANKGNWTSSLNMELTGTVTTNEGETVDNRVTFKPENGYNITLSGVLSGSGGLIKDGAEKLTLSGNNTYSGGTLVKAGTLAVSNVNSLGTGAVTVNGGTLDASPAGKSKTFANAIVVGENGGTIGVATGDYSSFASISGSGDLTTNGFLHFNGTGGYNGHVTVNSGYLRINPGAFGIFDLTLNGTSNFNVYETGTVQIGKLNSTTSSWLFASDKNRTYIFEIGAGTSSTDTASYSGYIRGSGSNIQNLTIKKVGDGTQTFNLGGVVYGTTTNSIKEVIVVKGKMIIDANNAFNAETTTGFWGTAPITINAGGTLEYNRAWNTSPNVMMTINGGTLTLKAAEYQNAITFNSGTVNGSGQLRVGYVGTGVWNVTGGVTTIENSIVTVKKDSINTFTINIADGATLDIKKNIAGLTDNNSYKGTNLVVNGSGTQGTGKIKFNPAAGSTITDTGTISFNNIQVELDGDAGWLENGYFNKS